jgi:Mg2+-importing ATPase
MPGLSSEQARQLLGRYGLNEPIRANRWSALQELLGLVANPLVLILLAAALVSAFVGERTDAILVVVMVTTGVGINFFQTFRSQSAARRLREQVASLATVMRDGTWQEIPRNMVVPGDVVKLSAGDLIPADAKLTESKDLYVQESALTGESIPAEKHLTGTLAESSLWLGTSVVSGSATAEVTATGPATQFGGIAARLSHRQPETAFEQDLRRFGTFILRSVMFLVLLLVLMSVAAKRDPLQSLLFAVALAVGLTPEFLPVITSVTLTNGAVKMARANVIVKRLAAIQNLGSIDMLCCDKTGTLTSGKMLLEKSVDSGGSDSSEPHQLACLNSRFETGIKSPLDSAILADDCGSPDYRKVDEIPFDFERRRLSVVVDGNSERMLITKGSADGILEICTGLDRAALEAARKVYQEMEAQGLRVLAVAHRRIENGEQRYTSADEHSLTLAGFLGFADPPLEDAGKAIAKLKEDGVTVKIITGDSGVVAGHVCAQIGVSNPVVVLGEQIDSMTDTALGHVAEHATVFARVSPAQKTRILLALKHRGHTVGFLGDGINDAPSLRAADVGISVSTAVDVAKDAADIILTKPGLDVLHQGISEGRRAFANVLKYLLMGTSSNFGNMFSMAAASVFLPFLPMLATQILLNTLLYDLSQVSIPSDNVDEDYLSRPHRWDFGLIRRFMIFIGPVSSLYDFLTFWVLLKVFQAGEAEFHTGWFVESLSTQTLVLFVIRTSGNPLKSLPSGPLAATVLGVSALGVLLPYTPLAGPLGFTPLPLAYLTYVAIATATYLLLVEAVKRAVMKRG